MYTISSLSSSRNFSKVIAKQSPDIIVAFFPIDRFLTPDLKSIFISSPAAFFAPLAAMIDPQTQPKLAPYISYVLNGPPKGASVDSNIHDSSKENTDKLTTLFKYLPQIISTQSNVCQSPAKGTPLEDACATAELLDRMSLNTVRVIVGGTMTVDVNNVPPQIASVDIEPPSGETTSSMWTLKTGAKSATLNGTIHGSFLGGATPTLVSPPSGITIKGVADGSTDTALQFTLTLTSNLPQDTKQLAFQVSKSSSTGSTIKSATYNYQIEGTAQTNSPQGGNGGAPNPASNLSSPSAPEKPVEPVKK